MPTFWDSVQSLEKINDIANIAVIFLSIFLTVAGLLIWQTGKRIDELKGIESAIKEKENTQKQLQLENEVRIAQAEANEAKIRVAEAQEKLKPNEITEEQKRVILSELINIKSANVSIMIASRMLDENSISYGKQIHALINEAGLPATFRPTSMHTFQGMTIFYHPKGKPSNYCEAIQNAFKKAGIEFQTTYMNVKSVSSRTNEAIYIIVGHK